jgi:hypothetical protein
MRTTTILSTALALSIGWAVPSFAALACMTAEDLSFNNTLARAIPDMGGATAGCVTGVEIKRYQDARKADRRAAKERIAALILTAKEHH